MRKSSRHVKPLVTQKGTFGVHKMLKIPLTQAQNYEMGEIPINTCTPPIHFPWENSISGVHIIRKAKGRMRCHGSYV